MARYRALRDRVTAHRSGRAPCSCDELWGQLLRAVWHAAGYAVRRLRRRNMMNKNPAKGEAAVQIDKPQKKAPPAPLSRLSARYFGFGPFPRKHAACVITICQGAGISLRSSGSGEIWERLHGGPSQVTACARLRPDVTFLGTRRELEEGWPTAPGREELQEDENEDSLGCVASAHFQLIHGFLTLAGLLWKIRI